jgi:hypothetical protein
VAETIQCPACDCTISPDGKQLLKRSEKFDDFEAAEKALPKIEARLAAAEAKAKAPSAPVVATVAAAPVKKPRAKRVTGEKKNETNRQQQPAGQPAVPARKPWYRRE